jgi:hypothetical protein
MIVISREHVKHYNYPMVEQPYVFSPSKYTPALGHPQLDIYLSNAPTERYFDTRQARFIIERSGDVGPIVVNSPWEEWMGASEQHVCAGRITMIDHQDNTHDAFSLGGSLTIQNKDDYTICKLVSTAPIFNLQDHLVNNIESTTKLLVDEFEELFAMRQAHWLNNETEYFSRLAGMEPLTLFAASLVTLEKKYKSFPVTSRSDQVRRAFQTVQHAIQLLQENDDWPQELPDLEEIL